MSDSLYVNGAKVPFDEGRYCKVDKDTFNLCTECGVELTSSCDGFGTSHGTCDNCIDSYEEDDE